MRTIHRTLSIIACALMLYLGVTGTLIQILDLKELFGGAAESSQGMLSINEGKFGNNDYRVVALGDFSAAALGHDLDYAKAFTTVLARLHQQHREDAPHFVELRVVNGATTGQAGVGKEVIAFDALSGARVEAVDINMPNPPPTLRQQLKEWHRFWSHEDVPGVYAELAAGIMLWTLIITGLIMYFRLLTQRQQLGRRALFWLSGDLWRGLHRIISVAAGVVLIVVAFSGTWLGFESTWHTFIERTPPTMLATLSDAEVVQMATATLNALGTTDPDVPIRVLRVRKYGGMMQGVAVTDEPVTRQLVFNTATRKLVGLTEPGYPVSGFPLGIETHENIKHLHSGMLLGQWARVLDLLAGLSLIFLSISGIIMYYEMWKRRKNNGRSGLLWN